MQNGTFTAPKSGRKSLFSSSERGKPLFWFWSKPKPYFNWFRETKTETKTPQSPAPQSPAPQSPAPQSPAPQSPAPQSPAPQSPAPQSPTITARWR